MTTRFSEDKIGEQLAAAWKAYCKIYAPIRADDPDWGAFKFAWDAAMAIAREMVDGN